MHRVYNSSGMSIYPLVFNLKSLLGTPEERKRTLHFINFWLNSIGWDTQVTLSPNPKPQTLTPKP